MNRLMLRDMQYGKVGNLTKDQERTVECSEILKNMRKHITV